MRYFNIFSIPFLTLFFILFPMLTPDETGSMGILVWGGLLILSLMLTANKPTKLPKWSYYPFLMWLFGVIISLISPYAEPGNDLLKYLAFVILFVLLTNYRYRWNNFTFAFKIYALISLVLSILVILSFITGNIHVDSIYEGNIRYSIGVTGLYKNPNYIAAFICQCLLVVLYMLLFSNIKLIIRMGLSVLIFLMTFAVFLTGTRAAIITVVLILFLLILHYDFSKKNVFFKILPFIILLAVIILNLDNISGFIDTFGSTRGGFTEDFRTDTWGYAFNKACDSFLFGNGLNCWNHFHKAGMLPGLHNIFLEFFLNQGLIGIVLLIITMIYGWDKVKKNDRFLVFSFCFINLFPLLFQNGLIDVTFWRVLVMNRIVMDFSRYSLKGIKAMLELK